MNEKEHTTPQKEQLRPKQHFFITCLDWIGLSRRHRVTLRKFLAWFKQPSNILSVAAIIAVIIVPWVEKIVKSDEELRTEIDMLLTSTNKVIAANEQGMGPSGSNPLAQGILEAERYNELERANAIATSIKHDVYPAVLFALASELCASGKFD